MTLKIRPMMARDKLDLMRILRSTPEFKPSEVIIAEEVIDSYLDKPHGSDYHTLVAEVDARVSGYICYGPTPLTEGTWDIYWMAVVKEHQGQGIGGALITYTENKIKEAQGRLILMETSAKPEYEKTRRFHHHRGYEIISRIPDFYAPGDDKLTFQKRLR